MEKLLSCFGDKMLDTRVRIVSLNGGICPGFKLNTGVENKGIRILVLHLAQTCLEQSSHLHPRLKNPNLVFMHRKQTLLFSTSSLRLPSKGKPSSSALVNTVRMCTTSSKVKSKVCKAVAQCSDCKNSACNLSCICAKLDSSNAGLGDRAPSNLGVEYCEVGVTESELWSSVEETLEIVDV